MTQDPHLAHVAVGAALVLASAALAGCTDTRPGTTGTGLMMTAAWQPGPDGGPAHLVANMRNAGNTAMDIGSMMATMNATGPMGPMAMEGMGGMGMGMMMQPGQNMSVMMHPQIGADGRMGFAHRHMGNDTAMPPGMYTVCMSGQCMGARLPP